MPELNGEPLVDPDPIALASLAIAVGAFVIQLADYYKKSPNEGARAAQPIPHTVRNTLSKLEEAIEDVEKAFRNIIRIAERGSSNVETELYAAPVRVGQSQLLLPKQVHQEFSRSLMEAFAKTGVLGLWISSVMSNHPEIAHLIGEKLESRTRQSAENFNKILSEGRPIREALLEANMLLQALREVVTSLVERN